VYLWSIDARCGDYLLKVKSVVERAVNDFVLFQVLQIIYDFLLVVVCRVTLWGLVGCVTAQRSCYFSVIIGCVENHRASLLVCWQNDDVLVSAEGCHCLPFLVV